LLYLSRHYRILHLEAALEELYTSTKGSPRRGDRRTTLVLSFDDGYYDNYTHAFALARQLQIPITIFLIPGYIESGHRFWWDEGRHLVSQTQVNEVKVEGRVYHLDRWDERNALAQAIDARVRYATSVSEREEFLVAVRKALAVPSLVTAQEQATLPLTWREVQEMEESGWVSFGAHTMRHPILAYLRDHAEVEYEVSACREVLEQQLGRPVRTFAYPVGEAEHIGEIGPRAVQVAGYDWAVTALPGFNNAQTNAYFLHRLIVDVDQHWLVVAAKASGIWGFFSRLYWMPITFICKLVR
jgi:peptidoglycan/xylan/chitin deacetylase (PgdA/CDA1 family)